MENKTAYICGPLTELAPEEQRAVKDFYLKIADVCNLATGKRAFVPHEYFDPIVNPDPSPAEVNAFERRQICQNTSLLIVAAVAPSWGGGIEVEIANTNGIPVIILYKKGKKVSRFLRGNPAVREIIEYENEDEVLELLKNKIKNYKLS